MSESFREHVQRRLREIGITQEGLAEALGVEPPTISRWLTGERSPNRQKLEQMATALGWTLTQLLNHETDAEGVTVPVRGFVGAGEQVFNFDEGPLEFVRPPDRPGAIDAVAVRVQGDSMYPRYEDGQLLFFYPPEGQSVPEDCIGRMCITQVAEGPTYVKRLRRGSRDGLYRLQSVRAPEIEDVELAWAARVRWTEEP